MADPKENNITKAEKAHLMENLKNIEMGLNDSVAKGVWKDLKNPAVLFSSVANINKHLMSLKCTDEK